MNEKTIEINTKDGNAPCYYIGPPKGGKAPAVILYMDAFGVRPALREMAGRLAAHGYQVLLPDLYYRRGPGQSFNPATAFNDGPEKDRLMPLFQSLTNQLVMEDTASFLDFLEKDPAVVGPKTGCLGYCMGGSFALTAAGTFPTRIGAAASIHGARLATTQADSPHLLASKMKGAVYVGIAGIDPHFTPEEKRRLEGALHSAGGGHTVEVYHEAKHGFAVNDTLAYNRQAAELHWQKILKLFAANLASQ